MTQKEEKMICLHFSRSRRSGWFDMAVTGVLLISKWELFLVAQRPPHQASQVREMRRNPGGPGPGSHQVSSGPSVFGCITKPPWPHCLVPFVLFTPVL